MSALVDVAIVGSGPYGLSVSAHLSALGVEHRVFGPPMKFWRDMPEGIFLKSPDFATNIYTPEKGHRFVEYCKNDGLSTEEPIPMAQFAAYGLKAQQRLVPHLEPSQVTRVGANPESFELELESGETLRAKRVVIATGLSYFEQLPPALEALPPELVTHTAAHRHYRGFEGKQVAVIGRGSSALEAAALLREAGAHPTLLVRESGDWLFAQPPQPSRSLRHRILYPTSVLGPGGTNFMLDRFPYAVHQMPEKQRVAFTRKHLGPWGPWWLAHRFEGKVPVTDHVEVMAAKEAAGRLALTLLEKKSGQKREFVVDHAICGTGYEPDVDRISFLSESLRSRLSRLERGPRVSRHFQSSISGLYFTGPVAAFSFGPLLRFVAGAEYASTVISQHIESRLGAERNGFSGVTWLRHALTTAGTMASHSLRR